ncbi:hypothetical protein GKA01_15940 [Gluconobacter kanchanaburiensis NBRC 103587]|uniref:Uncharacterized protein n=1 Tax=Gluconobacter kanchanaburiensis NBRC 103587 TaxID=1307948 RepID=A0A511BF51_9PROT|nr:hypothetical protein AA103587_0868 [Gluconobacter kanchanaburiensis NBRC 103587]GEK96397.1 hypothetical protein GKA01_15940 [Gluconobacter kanchanaburiensis NBRC 103587]
MLGNEDRMATHGRLFAVLWRVGGGKTLCDEGRAMLYDGIQPPAFKIESRLIVQMKSCPEARAGEAFEQFSGIKSVHRPTTF